MVEGAKRIHCNTELTPATDAYTGSIQEWACQQLGIGGGGFRQPYSSLMNNLLPIDLGREETTDFRCVSTDRS